MIDGLAIGSFAGKLVGNVIPNERADRTALGIKSARLLRLTFNPVVLSPVPHKKQLRARRHGMSAVGCLQDHCSTYWYVYSTYCF